MKATTQYGMVERLRVLLLAAGFAAGMATLAGCERAGGSADDHADHDHAHEGEDGHDHSHEGEGEGHDHEGEGEHGEDHEHDMVSLGTAEVAGMTAEFWQGHGEAKAGKELHLSVKLPGPEAGQATVRAWIGTEDRFASEVALAEYAADTGVYDVHAAAPDPLPEGAAWWVEVSLPGGQTALGSVGLR